MQHESIIRATNRVALYGILVLVYWVFTFMVITVFDLKVFREHITEAFYLSLFGIFAILAGALMLNVMSNLSRISDAVAARQGGAPAAVAPQWRRRLLWMGVSLPLVAAVLFAGDALSAQRKKALLISAAQGLLADRRDEMEKLADYQFTREYINRAARTMEVIGKIDSNFPNVELVVLDELDGKPVFLGFDDNDYETPATADTVAGGAGGQAVHVGPQKVDFIFSADRAARAYLDKALHGQATEPRFEAHKGNYRLFYPLSLKGRTVMLYFSDYQAYGKFGS